MTHQLNINNWRKSKNSKMQKNLKNIQWSTKGKQWSF